LITDIRAERAVIGSILVDSASPGEYEFNAFVVAKARLTSASFTDPDCRLVFDAMLLADADRKPVDLVTIGDYLQVLGFFKQAGAYGILDDFASESNMPSAARVGHYVHLVAQAAARRHLQATWAALSARADDQYETVSELLDEAEQGVKAARKAASEDTGAFDLVGTVNALRARLSGHDDSAWRWRTGVEEIDHWIGGIGVGEHWVFGGRSGHMKTAAACNVMAATLAGGHRVAMFRYEEQVEHILLRLASLECGVAYGDIDQPAAGDALDAALAELSGRYGGLLEIHAGLDLPVIEGVIARFKPNLVVYDTLQAMADQTSKGHGERRDLQVQSICQFVSRLAIMPGNQHAAILISQLQKGVGRPTMRELRESGAIEESADVVVLLWWPSKDHDHAARERVVVQVGKNRVNGKLGRGVSEIDAGTQRFGARLSAPAADCFLGSL